MKVRSILVVLLSAGIVMTALSSFFFTRLDQLVNGDLYNYGLQFNYAWAGQYWTYSRLITDLLLITIAVTSFLFVLTTVGNRDIVETKIVGCALVIIAIVATVLSGSFFYRLDYVVNHDLYMYGLQFSFGWVNQYWLYARLILALLGGAVTIWAFSIALVIKGTSISESQPPSNDVRALSRLSHAKLVPTYLFTAGVLALVLSINYTSSILAFIGLGLIFWGALLYYVRPEKYVKATLLDSTILPSLADLNQMITELGYKGKAVYLPPRYLKDFNLSRVYISMQKDRKLQPPEKIQEEDKVFLKNPEGMIITPPGMELARLFEKTLETDFTKVDLRYLEQNIPKLLIEDLEIAQNVLIKTANSQVCIEIEGSLYQSLCNEAKRFSNICGNLGCPLSSAIACAIAKATGNPTTIESEEQSLDGKITRIQYNIQKE
jgi:hypothetical protein